MDISVPVADEVSFYLKVSSEDNYDYLRFFIDDNEIDSWAGEVNWQQAAFDITAGDHTLKWIYDKDASVSNGSDCAWLDYIVLPGAAGATVLNVNVTATPESVCAGENSQLNALAIGGSGNYTYAWTPEAGLSDPTIANPVATPDATTTYTVNVSDGNENVSGSITLTVNPLPETPVISQVGQCLESSASSGNQWYDSNGPISGATNPEYCPNATGYYSLIVTNESGCSSEQSEPFYYLFTGLKEMDLSSEISVYPNPSNGTFYLNTGAKVENLDIRVSNMLNETVWQTSFNQAASSQFVLNLNMLSKGVYFLQLKSSGDTNNSGWHIEKLIIE